MAKPIAPEDILLTAIQQEACEMVSTGLTQSEIAIRLGKTRQALRNAFIGAIKSLGVAELKRRYTSIHAHKFMDKLVEANPDLDKGKIKEKVNEANKAARAQEALISRGKALDAQAKELGGMNQIAEDLDAQEAMQKLMVAAAGSGLPQAVIDALANRVLRGVAEPKLMPEQYSDGDLRDELAGKVRMVLGHIDEVTMGGAKLSELSATLRTLQEQVLLLDGRPTAILATADKDGMVEISKRFQAEIARRQRNTIEGECEEIE